MRKTETEYCLIRKRILGKQENGKCMLFVNGVWQPDTENLILDTKYGYDPYEEPGSPYAMYNRDIMEEYEQITAEDAEAIIRRQTENGGH